MPRLDLRPDPSLHCLPLPEATGSSRRQILLVGSEGRVGPDVANNGSVRPARAEEMFCVQEEVRATKYQGGDRQNRGNKGLS